MADHSYPNYVVLKMKNISSLAGFQTWRVTVYASCKSCLVERQENSLGECPPEVYFPLSSHHLFPPARAATWSEVAEAQSNVGAALLEDFSQEVRLVLWNRNK